MIVSRFTLKWLHDKLIVWASSFLTRNAASLYWKVHSGSHPFRRTSPVSQAATLASMGHRSSRVAKTADITGLLDHETGMKAPQQPLHNDSAEVCQADPLADIKLQLLQAQCVLDAKDREIARLRSMLSVSYFALSACTQKLGEEGTSLCNCCVLFDAAPAQP